MTTNLRSVDLNLLTVFDAVVSEGSLSAAGELLGMTQPAVSNAVSRLRLTFKDELFIRSRRGMSPTPRARELYPLVREALDKLQTLFDPDGEFDPHNSQRRFKLAIGDYGELVLLPVLLNLFNQYDGNLSIETFPELDTDSLALARQAQIDFYFDYRPPDNDQLDYALLGTEDAVVIARKGHPKFCNRINRNAYLSAQHIVLRRTRRQTLLERIWAQPVKRQVMAEVMQYAAMPELVLQSDCIATVPRRMAEYYAQLQPLTILPLPLKESKVSAYMIWHRSMEKDKGHTWLKDLILSLVEDAND
ncbi:MAG: LysR substrate-binding domain-containing protein [Pseudomonadota bacterium]